MSTASALTRRAKDAIRWLLPSGLRLTLQLGFRLLKDLCRLDYFKIARKELPQQDVQRFNKSLSIRQNFDMTNPLLESKRRNISLAIARLNDRIIEPAEIFSFWALVGRPAASNGFTRGLCMVNDALVAEYGGGLCQLASLTYHLALKAGFAVVERHSHVYDIYTRKTRYTPLGSDAAVVFGYKDLRLRNVHAFPVVLRFELGTSYIRGSLVAREKITNHRLTFVSRKKGSTISVETLRSSKTLPNEKIGVSHYQRASHVHWPSVV